MREPKNPYFGRVTGGLAVLGSAVTAIQSTGAIDILAGLSPKYAGFFGTALAFLAWLSKAPVGKRPQ